MDRHFVKALLFAWDRAEFRAGLQHLIDLDEVTSLLAALSVEDHDHEVELRAMDLLRSGLDTADPARDAAARRGRRRPAQPRGGHHRQHR